MSTNIIERYKNGERDFQRANLQDADLRGVDLREADLRGADLYGANLQRANFQGANLRDADLRHADLRDADLQGARLQGACLRGANLRHANLRDADLRGANLPPPTMILLANWGSVDTKLCVKLMRYDAENHPDSKMFKTWVDGGACPYRNCTYQRAANFAEKRALYKPGRPPSALVLAEELIKRYTKTREQ